MLATLVTWSDRRGIARHNASTGRSSLLRPRFAQAGGRGVAWHLRAQALAGERRGLWSSPRLLAVDANGCVLSHLRAVLNLLARPSGAMPSVRDWQQERDCWRTALPVAPGPPCVPGHGHHQESRGLARTESSALQARASRGRAVSERAQTMRPIAMGLTGPPPIADSGSVRWPVATRFDALFRPRFQILATLSRRPRR